MWKTLQASVLWAALSLLGGAAPLFAQSAPPTLPDHTVYGRLGSGTGSGPGQAIPFATAGPLLLNNTALAPNFPVIHPVITNSSCAPAHSLLWNDNNWCLSSDEIAFNSTDPSALLSFTPTGTPSNGATVTLTFKFGVGSCISSGSGCTASTIVTNGESLASVVAGLVTAIQGNANLYNNVAGSQGQILAVSSSGTTLSLDFNSNVAMSVAFSDSGSSLTSHLPSSCSTACTAALDTNPVFAFGRSSGAAPVNGSFLGNIQFDGTSSGSPASISTVYGQIIGKALNSTTNSIQGQLALSVGNSSAADALYVGNGLCTAAYGTASGCNGVDTIDLTTYYIANKENITRASSQWQFNAASGDPVVFSLSGAGFGIGMTPTGLLDVNGRVSSLAAGSAPTAGSGVTLSGGATPIIYAENWATSTTLPLAFSTNGTVSWGTTAGNTAVLQSTNNGAPSGDSITLKASTITLQAFGGSSLVNCGAASVSSCSLTFAGSSSGATALIASGTASGTLTLPATTDTIAVLGPQTFTGTETFSKQIITSFGTPTIASGACGATTNGTLASGSTNQSGLVQIGSAATTTCTISFSATITAPLACIISPANAAAAATGTTVARVSSIGTGNWVITGSALANANYYYICL